MNKLGESIVKISIITMVLLFVIFVFIKRFIYFKPQRKFLDSEENYTSFYIKNIHGWLKKNIESNKIIVYCQGNDNNMSYKQPRIKKLSELGYTILIFDYSGFGKSNGIPNEQNLLNDAGTIMAMIYKNYDKNNIVLYGEQLGSCIATYVARQYNINKLILDDPIEDIKDLLITIPKILKPFFSEFKTSVYFNGFIGKSLIFYDKTKNYKELIELSTQNVACKKNEKHLDIPWNYVKDFIEN